MDSSSKSYQNFEPRFDWLHHPDSHVLLVHLQGFRSSQLKVQVTSTRKLRVSGERRLDSGKWLRFHKEIDVPTDVDTDKISAKLEEGILYVKQPKKPSAVSSTNPPEQPTTMPKPSPESQPPSAAAKPKADPQSSAEPPKPAKPKEAAEDLLKLLADPPTVGKNAPRSQNERRQSQPSSKQTPTSSKPQEPPKPKDAAKDPLKLPADPPTVRQNASQSQNEKPQAQASGKQTPPPQKAQEKTEKETEEEKAKAHTNLKEALEKTRDGEGGKEGIGSKMGEEKGKGKEEEGSHGRKEKEGEVAEERRRRRRRRRSEEMVEETGRWRRREGYKQVIDGLVKELRTNVVTLVLGIAVFVIVYLKFTKKGRVDEEL